MSHKEIERIHKALNVLWASFVKKTNSLEQNTNRHLKINYGDARDTFEGHHSNQETIPAILQAIQEMKFC